MTANSPTSLNRFRMTAVLALALAAALGLAAAPAQAMGELPIGWQLSGGWYTDSDNFFIGGGARFSLARFTMIPNAEWVFVDSGSAYSVNVDFTRSILPLRKATAYIGAGGGLYVVDPEFGDKNSNGVLNLIAGAGVDVTRFKPFAQFKWIVVDGDDPLVFSIGARF